jgi:hypothetical protein
MGRDLSPALAETYSKSDKNVAAAFSPDTVATVCPSGCFAHGNVSQQCTKRDHRMTKDRRRIGETTIISPYLVPSERRPQGEISPLKPSGFLSYRAKMDRFETVSAFYRLHLRRSAINGLLSVPSATHCSDLSFAPVCDARHARGMLHNNNLPRIFAAAQHLDTPHVLSEHQGQS